MAGYPHPGIVEELVKWGAPVISRFNASIHVIDLEGVDCPLKGWTAEEIQRGLDALLQSPRLKKEIAEGERLKRDLRGTVDCQAHPCFNCPHLFDAYNCTGTSKTCENKYSDYDRGDFCGKRGRCFGMSCKCASDWSGMNCESGLCVTDPCMNDATCVYDDDDARSCICQPGWEGERCERSMRARVVAVVCIVLAALCAAVLTLIVMWRCRERLFAGPKKAFTGKNWQPKIFLNCYAGGVKAKTMVAETLIDVTTAMADLYPNATSAHIRQFAAYGSKLSVFGCWCCCKSFASKIGRHVFVEGRATDGNVWTFEKTNAGIIVQVSENRDAPDAPSVMLFQNGNKRAKMEKSVEDRSPKICTIADIIEWIVSRELKKRYHVVSSNCAFFANNLFVKFANMPYPIEPHELGYEDVDICTGEAVVEIAAETADEDCMEVNDADVSEGA